MWAKHSWKKATSNQRQAKHMPVCHCFCWRMLQFATLPKPGGIQVIQGHSKDQHPYSQVPDTCVTYPTPKSEHRADLVQEKGKRWKDLKEDVGIRKFILRKRKWAQEDLAPSSWGLEAEGKESPRTLGMVGGTEIIRSLAWYFSSTEEVNNLLALRNHQI